MQILNASFKDRSGYVFKHNNEYYRTVQAIYQSHYEQLLGSGLKDYLCKRKLFLPFEESEELVAQTSSWKVIKPVQLTQISYASEWSFEMYKDAALCTLHNCIEALDYDMVLKDANTYNIQFVEGKPILIDSLSFEKNNEGKPWIAYRQFIEQFVCPLLLMKYNHHALQKITLSYPNGIPINVCKTLLPSKAKLNPNVYLHIFLPSSKESKPTKESHFSKQKMTTLLKGLVGFVKKLEVKKEKSIWDDYYTHTILGNQYFDEKQVAVKSMLDQISFNKLVDYGANDGAFSMLYANSSKEIVSADIDYNCINRLYKKVKTEKIKNIHPIVLDLTSPTPSFGWAAHERDSIFKRLQSDVSLCLALVHHLAIQYNVPLSSVLELMHKQSEYLLIEFVEKKDEKVQFLLKNREDVFDQYDIINFELEIDKLYTILDKKMLRLGSRTLYLLKRK